LQPDQSVFPPEGTQKTFTARLSTRQDFELACSSLFKDAHKFSKKHFSPVQAPNKMYIFLLGGSKQKKFFRRKWHINLISAEIQKARQKKIWRKFRKIWRKP
jgi:hypothetical protein